MKRMRRIPLLMIVSLVGLLASLAFLRRESARYVPVNPPTSDLSVTRSVHDRDYTPYATLPSDVAPTNHKKGSAGFLAESSVSRMPTAMATTRRTELRRSPYGSHGRAVMECGRRIREDSDALESLPRSRSFGQGN